MTPRATPPAAPRAAPLTGLRVVVTRPQAQAEGLARLIRAAGGEALTIPALEIQALADLRPFHDLADRLESFDIAIFVSRNAVLSAVGLLRGRRGSQSWPARLAVATIGQGSREELETQGFTGVIAPPAQSDSEALLALPELAAVSGKRIVIFRGEGGRGFLGETLAARGANVEHAACYRRAWPAGTAALSAEWGAGVDAVTLTSAEGLESFLRMLGADGARRLAEVPLFVPHPRVAAAAARRGLTRVVVAGPRDAEMVAALVAYFGGAR